jgi:hypothetical protein
MVSQGEIGETLSPLIAKCFRPMVVRRLLQPLYYRIMTLRPSILILLLFVSLLLSACSKQKTLEDRLIGTWNGIDGYRDVLTFEKGSAFTVVYNLPKSMSGGNPNGVQWTGMWATTGDDTFSFREGGEVSSGRLDGDTIILSHTGGTSFRFRRAQ